jgi:hypothetical protein
MLPRMLQGYAVRAAIQTNRQQCSNCQKVPLLILDATDIKDLSDTQPADYEQVHVDVYNVAYINTAKAYRWISVVLITIMIAFYALQE